MSPAIKKNLHLSQLKKYNRKAYDAFVAQLVEDCTETFDVYPNGYVKAHAHDVGTPNQEFANDDTRSDGMSWEKV